MSIWARTSSLVDFAVSTFRLNLSQGDLSPSFDECMLSAFKVEEPQWFPDPAADQVADEGSGLTKDEREIMTLLVQSWAKFLALNPGSDDCTEFRMAIHRCQAIVGVRALGRQFPSYWS